MTGTARALPSHLFQAICRQCKAQNHACRPVWVQNGYLPGTDTPTTAELSTGACVARDERKATVGNSGGCKAWLIPRKRLKASRPRPAGRSWVAGCRPKPRGRLRPPPAAVAAAPPSGLPISEELNVPDDGKPFETCEVGSEQSLALAGAALVLSFR